ncbi:MAG: hypothetical protein H6707_08290 [Deltaproteobacteria bacterium]|nr:hypothetical protein [Deltaproteobacteria bacterium]
MRRLTRLALVAATAFVVAACGSDSKKTNPDGGVKNDSSVTKLDTGTTQDATVLPDGSKPTDGTLPSDGGTAACNANKIGTPCTRSGGECGAGMVCLVTAADGSGICTCPCTPDDPQTPVLIEDSCPNTNKNICGGIQLSTGQTQNLCFNRCSPRLGGTDCDPKFACDPRSGSVTGLLDVAVCIQDACTADSDCAITTSNRCEIALPTDAGVPDAGTGDGGATNPLVTKPCAGAGERCVRLFAGKTEGICLKDGKCDTASGLCGKHSTDKPQAAIGDPCTGDTDCGEAMRCQLESDPKALGEKDHGESCTSSDDCCGSCDPTTSKCRGTCMKTWAGGYCAAIGCAFASLTEFACPTGSTCNRFFYGGMCMKSCTMKSTDITAEEIDTGCRAGNYGDYECRGWNNAFLTQQLRAADTAVCDPGHFARCSIFPGPRPPNFAGLDCSLVGLNGDPVNPGDPRRNPTDMACRTLDGKKTTDVRAPEGFCFDLTVAGKSAP